MNRSYVNPLKKMLTINVPSTNYSHRLANVQHNKILSMPCFSVGCTLLVYWNSKAHSLINAMYLCHMESTEQKISLQNLTKECHEWYSIQAPFTLYANSLPTEQNKTSSNTVSRGWIKCHWFKTSANQLYHVYQNLIFLK